MIVKKYTYTANEQYNTNSSVKRNSWTNMNNATGNTSDKASSSYSMKTVSKKKVFTVPRVVAIADFRLTSSDIPSSAYINKVTIHVGMAVTKNVTVKAPVGSFMIYNGMGKVTQQSTTGKTGWYGSTYKVYPSKILSTSIQDVAYTISGDEWNKMKYSNSQLYNPAFGIDLAFREPSSMTSLSATIYIQYAYVEVDYEVPNYVLSFDVATSPNTPIEMDVGDTYCVNAHFRNLTRGNGGNQTVKIELPFGTELISPSLSRNSDGTYNWICNGGALASNDLKLCVKFNAFGLRHIDFTHNTASYPFYVYPYAFNNSTYEEVNIEHGTIQAGKESCWKISAKVNTNNSKANYVVAVDSRRRLNWEKLSSYFKEHYNMSRSVDNALIRWEIEPESILQGVTIANSTTNAITFRIPERNLIDNSNDVEIKFTGCFIPLVEGENELYVYSAISRHTYYDSYDALENDGTELIARTDTSVWESHRILVDVDALGHVLPATFKPSDRVMVEGDCTLKGRLWKNIAYIGCIPINRSHYEPEANYENELLKESFKNKTYMGKKGEINEETSLKIRLPPKDWSTLRGLTKLDKPIPLNLVPSSFEGDILNHRGWAELHAIKGITKTNPLYYDGELDVTYLTHDINSRFTITKGKDSSQFDLPRMVATVLNSGDEFADYKYLDENGDLQSSNSGYFNVDTDGTYIYDNSDDLDDTLRTYITLCNNQYINIKSKEALAEQADLKLTWYASKIDENRENNIERIIYLTDKSGRPVFKYQYYDYAFDYDSEYYSAMVKASRLLSDDTWEDVVEKQILFAVDLESLQLYADSDNNIIVEDESEIILEEEEDDDSSDGEVYAFNEYIYGSSVEFQINGTELTVIEEGYNGKSFTVTTELLSETYYYDLQFHNRNTDADTPDVINFFDFEIAESIITSDFSNYYKNMYVSPFPVPNKTVLFTRECNEGLLYFLKDDSTTFSYIQDPYYMYFCGVDITSKDGTSLFELNNSYSTFYLTNGLIRLGFNKLNGDLYLSKYDTLSKEFINVAYLHCTNTDFSIGAFSDDKIEIKAGNTVYVMYRGHPYVIIKHPDEDITFQSTFNSAWCEKINNNAYEFPVNFLLLNNSNLLPSCIGSRNINKSCLESEEIINTGVTTAPTLTLTEPNSTVYASFESIWQLSATNNILTEGVVILVDGEVTDVYEIQNDAFKQDTDGNYIKTSLVTSNKFGLIFDDDSEHTIRAVYYGSDTKNIAYSELTKIIPKQYIVENEGGSGGGLNNDGKYKLEIINLPSTYVYMSTPNWQWRLTKGGVAVPNKLIQLDLPHGGTWTKTTDAQGIAKQEKPNLANSSVLANFRKWNAGKTYEIRARFYDYDESNNFTTIAKRKITVTKGTPKLTFNPAGKKGKKAQFILKDPQDYPLTGKKIIIKIGSKKYTKTTNSNGAVTLLINKKGYKTYKVTYAGDTNLVKKTWTLHETVK